MNGYVHCDFYPDFHVNFIKKGSVNDVPPVTLKDMGLSDDVDYRDQPLEELPKARKEAIIAEFMFLIDRLLPRNIQDLFSELHWILVRLIGKLLSRQSIRCSLQDIPTITKTTMDNS